MAASKKTVEKIKKLVAKAKGTNNELEAQTFMAKANELLIKYNLSESDVEGNSKEYICSKYAADFKSPWERLLVTCLADANMTHVVFHWKKKSKSGVISILGDPINCDVTLHMFEVIRIKIREFCDRSAEDYRESLEHQYGHMEVSFQDMIDAEIAQPLYKYKDSYKKGFVVGLYDKFQKEKEERMKEGEREKYSNGPNEQGMLENRYELMVTSNKLVLEDMAEHEFEDVDLGNVNEVNFTVDEGSMKGQIDGGSYEHQKSLNGEGEASLHDEVKLIGE